MRRSGQLFEQLVSWQNLVQAARQARRGKRHRPNVLRFNYVEEFELLELQRKMVNGTYLPGPFRSFEIHEPKRRLISAAPFRDRVVHHAICRVIEPILERSFISDSFACRKGKGTHAAVRRAAGFAKQYEWVLKCDVSQFFPTVDHRVLLDALSRKFKDPLMMRFIEVIVSHPFPGQQIARYIPGDDLFSLEGRRCGLPIGNQTSQLFGNVVLDPLDQFVKRTLSVKAYVRYADDFVVFGNSLAQLQEIKSQIRRQLWKLRLCLNEKKSVIAPTRGGLKFLGFRIFPTHIRLASANVRKLRRRLRRFTTLYAAGQIQPDEIRNSVIAWWGHAQHAQSWKLLRRIAKDYPVIQRTSKD